MKDSMSNPTDLPNLLRYLTGESSAQEAGQIERWCAESPANQAMLDALREGPPDFSAPIAVDVPRAMARLRERLDAAEASTPGLRVHRTPWTMRYAMAGVCATAISLIVFGYHTIAERPQGPSASAGSTYTTANGRRAPVLLPDGTKVMLNVASKLEIPPDFLSGNRVVRLHGEAIFKVMHQTGTPFTVIAGPSTTRVLGTDFKARYYDTDTAAVIAVRSGKVAVQSLVLSAGQQVAVTPHALSRVGPINNGLFSFADGLLTLNEMPLTKAIEELNRWYDADILLGDPRLADRRVGGQFAEGSLEDLAQLLRLTFGVRVVQEGRTLTLYPGQE